MKPATLFLLTLLIAPSAVLGQVNPCDYGAIPNDGLDDSAAFLAAYKAGMATQRDVRVPAGVFDLNPLVHYVTAQLNIIGEGRDKTKLRRLVNRSWTQRFRCGKGAGIRIEGVALDGNAASLEPVDGDDQHHEIRIDQLGKTKMHLVTLQSVGVHDLVADGIQFVHNGLQQVTISDFEHLGGDKGRRNVQFSYHPKSAHVSDSTFRDFSTEPAGGTQNHMNLTIQDSTITGACNLQECGDLRARRLKIHRLSSLTCDSGVAEQLQVASMETITGPSNILIQDSRFAIGKNPLKFRARFNRHKQDVTFERCVFSVLPSTPSIFTTTQPAIGETPEAAFTFIDCHFPACQVACLQLGGGYDYRVENCSFAGDVGISVNARFGPMASLTESGNTWSKTSVALQEVTTGHPFELNIEPDTLKRLTGKGDYYLIETSTQSRE
ncbi:MAG: hypothetical protein AAF497_23270 [Planctomycetota bacterium]